MKIKTRITILNKIFYEFQQITQWLPNQRDSAYRHQEKAESLIELLEVEDCDSVGGFDKENPLQQITRVHQYDRFLALVRKYNNEKDIEKVCYFDLDKLGNYLKTVNELREKYNI